MAGLLRLREVVAYSSSDEESVFSDDDSPKAEVFQSGKMDAKPAPDSGKRHQKRRDAVALFDEWEALRNDTSTLAVSTSHKASFSVVVPGGKIN